MDEVNRMLEGMVSVQGGRFLMGNEMQLRERPVHEVTVAGFQIGRFQVTQAQWTAVMGDNPSHFRGEGRLPVDSVSWEMAQEFLHKLQELTGIRYRLPKENEWEFAARGGLLGQGYTYAGSNDLAEVAWFNGNSAFKTHPVGQKQPNELGLYDLCGNVWEWCSDRVPKDYDAPDRIPTWEEDADSNDRVLRGGSYINYAVFCRSTYRWIDRPDNVENYLGLRLAL